MLYLYVQSARIMHLWLNGSRQSQLAIRPELSARLICRIGSQFQQGPRVFWFSVSATKCRVLNSDLLRLELSGAPASSLATFEVPSLWGTAVGGFATSSWLGFQIFGSDSQTTCSQVHIATLLNWNGQMASKLQPSAYIDVSHPLVQDRLSVDSRPRNKSCTSTSVELAKYHLKCARRSWRSRRQRRNFRTPRLRQKELEEATRCDQREVDLGKASHDGS